MDMVSSDWEVVEAACTAPPWDFMWWSLVEEGREKNMFRQAITTHLDELPAIGTVATSDQLSIAESALKVDMQYFIS